MKLKLLGTLCLGAIISQVFSTAISQEMNEMDAGAIELPAGMVFDGTAMQAAQQLGPQHEHLKRAVGQWDLALKMYMMGPEGPAIEGTGTSEITLINAGRFNLENMSASFPMPGGAEMAFEGTGLLGYDNYRQQFVGCWADSVNTHLLRYQGSPSLTPEKMVLYGTMDEPGLGLIGRTVKYVTEFIGNDHYQFSIYDLAVAEDYLVMQIDYRRRP